MDNINKRILEAAAALAKVKAGQCGCMVKTSILKALLAFHPRAHVLAVWRSEIDNDLSISAFRVIIDKLESEGYISLDIVGEDNHCNVFPHLTETGKTKAIIGFSPCPACAKLQKLAKQCWHEAEYPHFLAGHFNQPCGIASKEASCKNGCGLKWDNGLKIGGTGGRSLEATFRNPTYTVQTMCTLLEALGEWEGFKWFMVLNCSGTKVQYLNDVITTMSALDIIDKTSSDDHMREVVVAYLEKRIMEG